MPPVSGEAFLIVVGSLALLGGIAMGLKRIRDEVGEIARLEAGQVAGAYLKAHVTEEHGPVMKILTEIRLSVARVEVKLAERHGALADRLETVEEHCREAAALGFCPPTKGGAG